MCWLRDPELNAFGNSSHVFAYLLQPAGPENNKIYLPREFYSNLKPVPTVATTAALGGDKYRKNLSHQGTR